MKVTALVPMKGNSERVPNKNLKLFNGVPLYHKVINTLLESRYISEILINTDSVRIKKDVKNNFSDKVVVINRPKEIIGDYVSMNKIIEHDINLYKSDLYIQTHSTNPLLKTDSIDTAIEKFIEKEKDEFDSVFSVTRLQTRLYDIEGKAFNHNPEELIRTQDLPPLYEENSNFYIFTRKSFSESNNKRIGCAPYMFEIDKIEALDIDEPQDFLIAEAIDKIYNNI